MSILAAADPVTLALALLLVAVPAFGFTLFFVTGCHRPRRILGPPRLLAEPSARPALLIFILAAAVWLGVATFYSAMVQVRHQAAGTTQPIRLEEFTPRDMAALTIAPPLLGLAVMLVGHAVAYPRGPEAVGFRLSKLPRGLLLGLVGYVIILPLVFITSYAAQLFYQLIRYQHPGEHDLLRVMGEASNPAFQALLAVSATTIVPLFEEMLFRGHLQSLVARLLHRPVVPPPPAAAPDTLAVPVPPEGAAPLPVPFDDLTLPHESHRSPGHPSAGLAPLPVLPYEPVPQSPAPAGSVAGRWLAVAIVSLVFAIIHPLWSAPPIFVLAVGLGYAYERTGNLYVPITMHALFNGLNTVQYLMLLHAKSAGAM